jgi:hypothetical protein
MLCHLSYKAHAVGGIRTRNASREVARAFATPQTLQSAHTSTSQVVQASACVPLQSHHCKNFREESALTEPGFEPEPFGFCHEVAVNFTIPGKTLHPQRITLDRNDLSGEIT